MRCRGRTGTQKENLCCAMSLEGWIGARSHRETQIATCIIFITLQRRSHCSIISRWVTKADILTREHHKHRDESYGDKLHYYI